MNLLTISWANLRFRRLSAAFNVLILALGIATIITLLHISEQVGQRFERDLKGIDLVVGAKGSPLQLILSSVFHLDIPTGNIPLEEAEKLKTNPLIQSAIPIALGDSFRGFRIVGTTPDYAAHYAASPAQGGFWSTPMQAVLGSEVARITKVKLGADFVGSHGLTAGGEQHEAFPYRVVGILTPTGTVIDRLVLTGVASVWKVHEAHHHHEGEADDDHDHEDADGDHDHEEHDHEDHDHAPREVTAMLLSYKSPAAAVTLPRLINKTSAMQAASPAFEMARLLKIVGVGGDAVRVFGGLLMLIAAVGFFITLLGAVNERRYDLALIRSLGATRRHVLGLVLAEGLSLGVLGTVLGVLLGHLFAYAAQCWIEQSRHMTLNSVGFHPLEIYVAALALLVSVVAALIPALMAYRVNVSSILSKGQ